MKLKLIRNKFLKDCTIGTLLIDDRDVGIYTLEDAVREFKVPGATAIPYGTYKVIVTYSNRFKRELPLLLNVPNFEGIRIHPGNSSGDTEGCILVGKEWNGTDFILQSGKAFAELFDLIKKSPQTEIEILCTS